MRWWLRSLAVGAGVGLVVGFVVGGTLGRLFMRALAVVEGDARGLETAFGATVGEVTVGGTFFLGLFAGFVGVLLGLGYVVVRPLLDTRLWVRELVYVVAATGVMLRPIVNANLEDFSFLPVTLGLLLVVGSLALTALPVPYLVERFASDRERRPGRVANSVVGLGLVAIGVSAALSVADAYAVESLF